MKPKKWYIKKIYIDSREKTRGYNAYMHYCERYDLTVNELDYGDYKIYKDNSVVIDRKDNLTELAHNLCSTTEHERIRKEIQRAKDDNVGEFSAQCSYYMILSFVPFLILLVSFSLKPIQF